MVKKKKKKGHSSKWDHILHVNTSLNTRWDVFQKSRFVALTCRHACMFALSVSSCFSGMRSSSKCDKWPVYQTMSSLEPEVNNWHRHDPWRTMLWLLLFLFTRRANQPNVRLHAKLSVSICPEQVLIFLTCSTAAAGAVLGFYLLLQQCVFGVVTMEP